ncbi:hypothetical protein B0I35DRAFT_432488 [Stachybotrys elegans]|uniref:FAD/NAD(P)-binding domain-containing protein n=1 Tax=Stachybotrys elegans TaxID=80388 RepID=A0A8K0SPE0_9HYPO|nr:hypothetical protein B0I35DRAFT_432488 [Stachybotrys elegans]
MVCIYLIENMGSMPKSFNVKSVAIVGAGPSGLCMAKYLRAQGSVQRIVILEQQPDVGGVWKYTAIPSKQNPVPQEDPQYPHDGPVEIQGDGAPLYPSPMYEKLHANVPAPLMQFSDQPFPTEDRLFPKREAIQAYLERYSADVRHLIKFSYQVKKISRHDDGGRDKWTVEAQSTINKATLTDTFDAVVVASGHYSVSFLPNVKNMKQFHETHPSVITHSKNYRKPDDFRDKKVVIVGNGPSGSDLAAQISAASQRRPILSVRHATPPARLAHIRCEEIAEIDEFLVDTRGIRCKDGHVENDLDAIIYCTGFLYSYPFLPDFQSQLITGGHGVHGLYKHLFLVQHPTLVFPGLNMKSTPWQLSESQAAVISAVWANQLDLPPVEEMQKWSRELSEDLGDFPHVFKAGEDVRYINELHDWAIQAGFLGKEPPLWNEEMAWLRSLLLDVKMRFEELGCQAKTVEELGLEYKPSE